MEESVVQMDRVHVQVAGLELSVNRVIKFTLALHGA